MEASKENSSHLCSKRRLLILGIACAIVLVIAVVIAVAVVVTKKDDRREESSRTQSLTDVLPSSFYAELEIYNLEMNKWAKVVNQRYHVEWDIESDDLRYLKTMSDKLPAANGTNIENPETMEINVTMVNKESVSTLLYNGSLMTGCHSDVYGDGFFFIIGMASNATQKAEVVSECQGRVWTIPTCNGEILICEKDSKLLWVIQGGMRAETVKWELRKPGMIVLPEHNGTCSMEYPELHDEGNCSDASENGSSSRSRRNVGDKECLFVHGVGEVVEGEGYKEFDSYPDYWGNIERETTQCKSHRFLRMNTISYGWDNNILHENFCSFASGSNKRIENKLIFSHSMGNLIIAAALFKGNCALDTFTTTWYTVQAPWTGSTAADILDDICSGRKKVGSYFFSGIVRNLLVSNNFCTESGGATPAYGSLTTGYRSPNNVQFENLVDTAKQYANGSMCGDSPGGLWKNWLWSTVFKAIQSIVSGDPKSDNDGVVSRTICESEINQNFKEGFGERFYMTRANHFEGTCRFGDVGWGPPRWKMDRPCQWYKQRQ